MEFFDRADHVADMFDDMHGADMVEGRVCEWVGPAIDIDEHVGGGTSDTIDSESARVLVDSAAYVEDAVEVRSRTRTRRHSSSVSTAKSA